MMQAGIFDYFFFLDDDNVGGFGMSKLWSGAEAKAKI